MAAKAKAKALKVLNWEFVKGEKNNMLPMTIQENSWAVVTPNKTEKAGDYEFKEENFILDIINGTGFIAPNGDKWLLCCVHWDSAKEAIEIAAKDWVSDKWEFNKDKTEEALEAWKATGCLTAIKANGFIQLEVMAELLNGISFEYRDAKVSLVATDDLVDKEACKWFIDFQYEHGDVPKLSRSEKDKTVIKYVKSCKAINFEPTINITDPSDFSDALLPFEFKQTENGEADYPNLLVNWTPPVIEERKKSNGNWNNGSTVNVSETSPKDRLEFVYSFTGTSTPEDLMNVDSRHLLTGLLLSGVSLSDAYVNLFVNNGNPQIQQNTKTTTSSVQATDKVQSNSDSNGAVKPAKVESTNGKQDDLGEDYVFLINQWAEANPNKLSPDLDLISKSSQWLRLFYALLTGTIQAKPLLGTEGRANTTKIKREFGKALHELNETELGTLAERLDVKHKESSDTPIAF